MADNVIMWLIVHQCDNVNCDDGKVLQTAKKKMWLLNNVAMWHKGTMWLCE